MEQAWLLPAIPVAIFVVISLFNRLLPRNGDWLAILGMVAVMVIAVLMMLDFQDGGGQTYGFVWTSIGGCFFVIEFSTYVDAIILLMLAAMSVVTLMVLVYSARQCSCVPVGMNTNFESFRFVLPDSMPWRVTTALVNANPPVPAALIVTSRSRLRTGNPRRDPSRVEPTPL